MAGEPPFGNRRCRDALSGIGRDKKRPFHVSDGKGRKKDIFRVFQEATPFLRESLKGKL